MNEKSKSTGFGTFGLQLVTELKEEVNIFGETWDILGLPPPPPTIIPSLYLAIHTHIYIPSLTPQQYKPYLFVNNPFWLYKLTQFYSLSSIPY